MNLVFGPQFILHRHHSKSPPTYPQKTEVFFWWCVSIGSPVNLILFEVLKILRHDQVMNWIELEISGKHYGVNLNNPQFGKWSAGDHHWDTGGIGNQIKQVKVKAYELRWSFKTQSKKYHGSSWQHLTTAQRQDPSFKGVTHERLLSYYHSLVNGT